MSAPWCAPRLLVVLVAVVVAVGCAGAPEGEPPPPLHPSIDGYPAAAVALHGPDGQRVPVAVRVADTPERRQHGLMEVPELPDGVGMLFVYTEDRPADAGFWMRDTLVPLDIAYLSAAGRPVAVVAMDPCLESPCPTYPPGQPYRYALEVRQGWLAEVGFTETWTVELPSGVG